MTHSRPDVDHDHQYGRVAVCSDCGRPVHRARWLGLNLDLEATTVPVTTDLAAPGAARGVMQWHPDVGEWSGVVAGARTWRETRAMHSLTCPATGGAAQAREEEGTRHDRSV